ncbi:hypothetical protein ACV35N_36820, partial [Pseudomonas aeruginosa]
SPPIPTYWRCASHAQCWRQQHSEKPLEQLHVEPAGQLHDKKHADNVVDKGSDQGVPRFRSSAQDAEDVGEGDAHRQDVGMG